MTNTNRPKDSMTSALKALLPNSALDEQAQMASPHSLRKQALARAIAESEIQMQATQLNLQKALQQQQIQEAETLGYRKEVAKPAIQRVLSPAILAELQKIPKMLDGIKSNLTKHIEKLRKLKNELELIRQTEPEVIEHLASKNTARAEKNVVLLSSVLDRALPELSPVKKTTITEQFRKMEESATTVVMAEARYRRSLQKADMEDIRDTIPENVPADKVEEVVILAKDQKKKAIATKNVMVQELSMRFLLAQLLAETLGIPLVTANMQAGNFLAAAMTSEEVSSRIRSALSSFEEREIDSAVTDLAQAAPGEALVAKLTMTQTIIHDIADVQASIGRSLGELNAVEAKLKAIGAEMHYRPEIDRLREEISSPLSFQPTPRLTRSSREDDKS